MAGPTIQHRNIEHRNRFVGNYKTGLQDQHAADIDALELTSAEQRPIFIPELVGRLQFHFFQGALDQTCFPGFALMVWRRVSATVRLGFKYPKGS
jgi:hypothetical protein